ncbi:hypothetical protein IWQ61_010460 [Dispira simplex]|nr:hypothetical protein IWQ61_010460 [Dispira simplex]
MKINILTIAPLVLTALLVTGSPDDTNSDEGAIEGLLFFSKFLLNTDRGIHSDIKATNLLYFEETARGMLKAAEKVGKMDFNPLHKNEIIPFLASNIGVEFMKDLCEIICKDDGSISDREAKISLLFFAKSLTADDGDSYRSFIEVINRIESWQMAEAVLKVIEGVKKNFIEGSDKDMVTKFLDSDIAETFQVHLTSIINGNKAISSSESPGRSNPGTSATMKVTLTSLYLIYNDKGGRLFSIDDIPAIVHFLNRAAKPSDGTQTQ